MSKLPGRQQKGNRLPEHRRDRVPLAQGPTSRDRKELAAHKCPPCPDPSSPLFVAAGSGGNLATSTDGENWTLQKSGTNQEINCVRHGGGIVVGACGAATVILSSDGTIWAERPGVVFGDGVSLVSGVAHGGGTWVAVGEGGRISTSPDGDTWTEQASGGDHFSDVGYADGLWVAVGESGRVETSTDGESWTDRSPTYAGTLNRVAHGDGLWVAGASGGDILTSTDGTSWTVRSSVVPNAVRDIIYADGLWLLCGNSDLVASSSDGVAWTTHNANFLHGPAVIHGIARAGSGRAVLGGEWGSVSVSDDGKTWTGQGEDPAGFDYASIYHVAAVQVR